MKMKTRTMLSIGLSAFVLAGTMAGVAVPGMMASAASAENPKQAASQAKKAAKAIAKRNAVDAVKYAEAAVGYDPHNAEYRALLGQAYLLSGRFASAKQALTDSLSLNPSDSRVALNLALAQVAEGDWQGARGTLEAHTDIAASDRGLAFALAGDPVRAIEILGPAARETDSTAKTRQNLALSLALAGRWEEAKTVAAVDVAPDQVDARIMQWAAFARPNNAYDQVASLLGVRAVEDAGQPSQLALNQSGTFAIAAAAPVVAPTPDAVDAYMPGTPANADTVVAETDTQVPAAGAPSLAETDPAPVEVAGTNAQVVFGPREEVVQKIPAVAIRPAASVPARAAPMATAVRVAQSAAPMAKGRYFVQLGAYVNPAVARDAWRRTAQRVPGIGKHSPQGARVSTKAGNFYRLSVGGFARNDADLLCRQVKSSGGACFVRVAAGDQVASWARQGGTQVAAR
jgi:Flp pilus assembly protein TadD